jgi:hypothetical protein
MGSLHAVGAGEAIGCLEDRTGSSGFSWLNALDDAKGGGTERRLSQTRLNCARRSASTAASLSAVARSLSRSSFSCAFAQAFV